MAKKSQKTRKDGLIERVVDGHHFYGRTEAEILKKAKCYNEKKDSGVPFRQLATDWKFSAFPSLSPNTLKGYSAAYKKAIAWFEDARWKTITSNDCRAYMDYLRSKNFAFKTVSNHMLVLHLIFQYGCVQYNHYINPMQHVKVPRDLPRTKRSCPDADAIKAIKENADACLFFYFLLYTGLRLGEALALEYSDIDFKNKTLSVSKSLYWQSNKPMVKHPKTNAGIRTIPLLDKLAEHLPTRGKGIVFANDGEYYTNNQAWDMLENCRKILGVHVTPHELRHAYATMCFEAGLLPKDVQHLLGHADISTSMNIYTDWRQSQMVSAAEKLNNYDFS